MRLIKELYDASREPVKFCIGLHGLATEIEEEVSACEVWREYNSTEKTVIDQSQ